MGVRRFRSEALFFSGGGTVYLAAGEVLRHAWQITWAHKALWFFNALPLVPFLFYLPLIAYFFLSKDFMIDIPRLLNNPSFLVWSSLAILATGVVSFILQVFSRSATTFTVIRFEQSGDRLMLRE